jgi:DNA polymerase-4
MPGRWSRRREPRGASRWSTRSLAKRLLHLADELSHRLRAESLAGRTITLKYRDETFRTTTHARSRKAPTNIAAELFEAASSLLHEVHGSRKVRLLGIAVSGFHEPAQKSLFEDDTPKPGERIDLLRETVREKFGRRALVRASELEK